VLAVQHHEALVSRVRAIDAKTDQQMFAAALGAVPGTFVHPTFEEYTPPAVFCRVVGSGMVL
jgi:hypothetical protein